MVGAWSGCIVTKGDLETIMLLLLRAVNLRMTGVVESESGNSGSQWCRNMSETMSVLDD